MLSICKRIYPQLRPIRRFCNGAATIEHNHHESMMRLALEQAKIAYKKNEVPVGCIIIENDSQKVIAKAFNEQHSKADATAHAEIQTMRKAAHIVGDWRLDGHTMYCTLEPCNMCMESIRSFRMDRVVYGAYRPDDSLRSYSNDCKVSMIGGVLENECSSMLKEFFESRREQNKIEKAKQIDELPNYAQVIILDQHTNKVLLLKHLSGDYKNRYTGIIRKINAKENLNNCTATVIQTCLNDFRQPFPWEKMELTKVGTFQFVEGVDRLIEHEYLLKVDSEYTELVKGLTMNSEEYELHWFPVNAIPYHLMPKDDKIWYPLMLDDNTYEMEGKFHFEGIRLVQYTLSL